MTTKCKISVSFRPLSAGAVSKRIGCFLVQTCLKIQLFPNTQRMEMLQSKTLGMVKPLQPCTNLNIHHCQLMHRKEVYIES